MRTVLIVLSSLSWIVSAAFAQTPPPKLPDAQPLAPSAPPSKKGKGDRSDTAEKQPETEKSGVTDSLASCLEMWEPTTHMSRQEWARACRRVADRLKNTEVK